MEHECKLPEILVGFSIFGWQNEETIYICECGKVYVIGEGVPQYMYYRRAWVLAINAKPRVTVREEEYPQSARSEDEISTADSDGIRAFYDGVAYLSSRSASTNTQADQGSSKGGELSIESP